MNYWNQSEKNIYVAAHMGWCEKYPANTMEAFIAAGELGVDQIELDLRVSKDGEIVVIHDATVDRTTNGSGKVCEFTLKELKKLDAGIKHSEEFEGTRIPTFYEFMEYVKGLDKMTLDVELKEYPIDGNDETAYDMCDRVLAMLEEYGYSDRCVINTWNGKLNEYIFKKYDGRYKQHVYYPQYHLGECTIDPYSYGYCVCMFGKDSYIATKEEFDEIKAKYGIRTWAGAGVRDEATVNDAIERGAELITCNNPDVILDLLHKKGYHE